MITKEKLRNMYNSFFSKISFRDIFFGTILLFLSSITLYNTYQINNLTKEPIQEELKLENEKFSEEEVEEKGITFLILKEESKQYDLEGLLKRYPKAKPYIPYINKAVKKYQHMWPIDNLTVFAKIRFESEFSQFAISPKIALGPCQLMPYTAKDLGLKVPKELEPEGFYKARIYDRNASSYHSLAINAFLREEDETAKYYRSIYKKNQKIAEELYSICKREIKNWLKTASEEDLKKTPFDIEAATDAGTRHLAFCFKSRKGDFRESFSAYNAGLGPVKKEEGIPFIRETVHYQNDATNFYKYWSQKLKITENNNFYGLSREGILKKIESELFWFSRQTIPILGENK
ncbi:MAG: lytic transglycosylase domain-containing protein [Candidatus Pacearchaeota archaeon]|nr:MAG: lytic transglycosylase domain-containing protein [Candidatus Pacearchaeota archaeon]